MQSQNSPTKIKYRRVTQQTKEIKNYVYQLRTKLTKHKLENKNQLRTKLTNHKLENKTKAKCQVGKKAMKTKLTDMLRQRKEIKERIDMQSQR